MGCLTISGPLDNLSSYLLMQAEQIGVRKQSLELSILERHEKLLQHLARSFARQDLSAEDLMQEGYLALLRAAETWEGRQGASFWTYAKRFVKGAMFRFVENENAEPCRRPQYASIVISEFDDTGECTHEVGFQPPSSDSGPETALEQQQRLRLLGEAMKKVQLSLLEVEVVRRHFFEGKSFRELAKELGSSNTEVQRVQRAALDKLRSHMGARA